MRGQPFVVSKLDGRGVELLLGAKKTPTRISWECLEGIPGYLAGRGWVAIGGAYDTGARAGTLDRYLKAHINRGTAGWVAALLEEAAIVEIDRTRPARARVRDDFMSGDWPARSPWTGGPRAGTQADPPRSRAPSVPAPEGSVADGQKGAQVVFAVRFRWEEAGEVVLSVDRQLRFPELPREPGVYRLVFQGPPPQHVYVGEAADLRRRMGNYRNPGPTQQTSLRVNGLLIDHLAGGGTGRLSVAFSVEISQGRGRAPADLSNSNLRRLAEHAAIACENAGELHNR